MTASEKTKIIQGNTIAWLVAMLLPGVLYFAFASTNFPWPILVPLALVGFLINSNKVLDKAIGETADSPVTN